MKRSQNSKEILEKLLKFIGVDAKISEKIDDSTCKLAVECKEAPLLIGYHGENLMALQHVVNLLWLKDSKEERRFVFIDVSGYRKDQEERIKKLALEVALKVKKVKRLEVLRPMTGYERRLVHITLADDKDVITESMGEEPSRRVVVKLKKE